MKQHELLNHQTWSKIQTLSLTSCLSWFLKSHSASVFTLLNLDNASCPMFLLPGLKCMKIAYIELNENMYYILQYVLFFQNLPCRISSFQKIRARKVAIRKKNERKHRLHKRLENPHKNISQKSEAEDASVCLKHHKALLLLILNMLFLKKFLSFKFLKNIMGVNNET